MKYAKWIAIASGATAMLALLVALWLMAYTNLAPFSQSDNLVIPKSQLHGDGVTVFYTTLGPDDPAMIYTGTTSSRLADSAPLASGWSPSLSRQGDKLLYVKQAKGSQHVSCYFLSSQKHRNVFEIGRNSDRCYIEDVNADGSQLIIAKPMGNSGGLAAQGQRLLLRCSETGVTAKEIGEGAFCETKRRRNLPGDRRRCRYASCRGWDIASGVARRRDAFVCAHCQICEARMDSTTCR